MRSSMDGNGVARRRLVGPGRRGCRGVAAVAVVWALAAPAVSEAQHGALDHAHASMPPAPLTAPGNAPFAAIQEVVEVLSARNDTDWSTVDLEALRLHLIDMHRFTLEADVVDRREVPGGLRVVVVGVTPEADASIRRALHVHAPMLEAEFGWRATVEDASEGTVLTVVAEEGDDVARIRGLGYIGLMASGAHHAEHHWAIATGRPPHGQ